jgi:hypothetical protein
MNTRIACAATTFWYEIDIFYSSIFSSVGNYLNLVNRIMFKHYYKYDIWLRDFTSGICIPEVKYNWAKIPLLLRKIYEVES